MINKTGSSPHLHDGRTLGVVMTDVCIALAPGLLCYVWLFGPGVLLQCILAVSFALLFEFAVLRLRGRDPRPFLRDGSAIVTAMLFAVSISPLAAWWVCLCGIAFAIIIAKHAFGGIGYNIFNPAMAGFVFVLVCFPVQMNTWPDLSAQGLGAYLGSIFPMPGREPDMLSGATPLDDLKTRLEMMEMVPEIRTASIYGYFGGAGWEWINVLFMLGGIYLLVRGVIKWHIPVSGTGRHFHRQRGVLLFRCGYLCLPVVPPVQRRHDAVCILYRHGPRHRVHDRARAPGLWRHDRHTDLPAAPVGGIPGRRGVCRTPGQYLRPAD